MAARRPSRLELHPGALLDRLQSAPDVTVVVPVYNGGDAVERCLSALVRHTRQARLVVIDDASTDPAVVATVDRFAASGALEAVRHETNLGYTRTANHALEVAAPGDVVLLNSDTEVGPCWLQRLRWVAYGHDNVATVTAVSDNAGAMAVPEPGRLNEWPTHLPWEEVARYCARAVDLWAVVAPTGNGFCMYIRRTAIGAVGGFDADAFPRGYGEENDWCMRARALSFVNLIAPHVLVHHARGKSFGAERERLMHSARQVLDDRHPTYTSDVRSWMGGSEDAAMRDNAATVIRQLAVKPEVRPRRLYVLHRSGGGTPATNQDLLEQLDDEQESYVLESDSGRTVRVFQWVPGQPRMVAQWQPKPPFAVVDDWRPDYAEFLTRLLVDLGLETIHIRHLINQPLTTLPRVARLLGIPVVLSTHDFYYVCPTVHLLDEHDRYCGGICTPGDGTCHLPTPFVDRVPPLKHRWIQEWRRRSIEVLRASESVVATTESAAKVYRTVFGSDISAKLRVIEHGRDLGSAQWVPLRESRSRLPGPLRILAPANWDFHKGVEYVRQLANRVGPAVEWHIIGRRSELLGDIGICHGGYGREGLPARAAEIDPDLVGLFSICAETYSHTLSEAWSLGIPVLATGLGAVGDRIRQYGGGILLPVDDIAKAAQIVTALAHDHTSVARHVGPVNRRAVRSLRKMAGDYRRLYEDAVHGDAPSDVGYVLPTRQGSYTASAYIRTLRRIAQWQANRRALWHPLDPSDLIGSADIPGTCIVQRDAIPGEQAEALLQTLSAAGSRLVVDIDDDLVSGDARRRLLAGGYDDRRLDGLRRLLAAADAVTTSTESLAHSLRELTDRAVVVPNYLDPRLWCADAATVAPPQRDELRILYMGTKTHTHDLMLLRDVVPALRRALGRSVVLELVGVADERDDETWFRRMIIPRGTKRYPHFVPWLRSHAGRWAVAVAPLVEDSMNATKSDLKLLEYAMLGLPAVASDVGPYRDARHLAVLAKNDCASFVDALSALLTNPAAARSRVESAQDWVRAHRVLNDSNVDLWCDIVLGTSRRTLSPS